MNALFVLWGIRRRRGAGDTPRRVVVAYNSALTWSVAVGLFRWPAWAEVVVVGVVHEWFAAVFEHLGLVDGGKIGALSEP